jgi:hypothetical protein
MFKRSSCTSPVPSCGGICGKTLSLCGHKCVIQCGHEYSHLLNTLAMTKTPCECGKYIVVGCRCGKNKKVIKCCDLQPMLETIRKTCAADGIVVDDKRNGLRLLPSALPLPVAKEEIVRLMIKLEAVQKDTSPVERGSLLSEISGLLSSYDTKALPIMYVCDSVCYKTKNCGRHKCQMKCCPSALLQNSSLSVHLCSMKCGRLMHCGRHYCSV